jgi:hypothetical protein
MSVATLDCIFIFVGLSTLVVGLLSLATFEPMIFIFCNYAGVVSLLAGFVTKLGLVREGFRSKNGVIAVLLLTSGLLFVTAVNMLFIDVEVYAQQTRFAFTNANKLCLTFIRPYAYLFLPLMEAGVFILIIALVVIFFDNFL